MWLIYGDHKIKAVVSWAGLVDLMVDIEERYNFRVHIRVDES